MIIRKTSFFLSWLITACNSNLKNHVSEDSKIDTTKMVTDTLNNKQQKIPEVKISTSPFFMNGTFGNYLTSDRAQDSSAFDDHSLKNLKYCGYVFLEQKEFSGDEVPFVCTVSDNIKALYVDSKKIRIHKYQEFFFRQKIKLFIGYNRIPITIINSRDEETQAFLEITMKNIN